MFTSKSLFVPFLVYGLWCSYYVHCKDISSREISFPTANLPCFLPQFKLSGKCVHPKECPGYSYFIRQVEFRSIVCHDTSSIQICCPDKIDNTTRTISAEVSEKIFDITQPENFVEECGTYFEYDENTDIRQIYVLNDTADELIAQGFTIFDEYVFKADILEGFNATNGTFTKYFSIFQHRVSGGKFARRTVTLYMALLGFKYIDESINWRCDGVLLNFEWVLTAAHCFTRDINVVRLGEYNITRGPTRIEDPRDYGIKRIVVHPEYKFPSSYHDLALIQLSKKTFLLRPDIKPICLPWGQESRRSLLNKEITLTGWGATVFGGPSSEVAMEVNITVFSSDKCQKSYSVLNDFSSKFPRGMTEELTMCAGDLKGSKDACQGDSGGPVVYVNDEGKYTLAGIVSSGHGCGLKEFPGIYIPILRPNYLGWIKLIAFS